MANFGRTTTGGNNIKPPLSDDEILTWVKKNNKDYYHELNLGGVATLTLKYINANRRYEYFLKPTKKGRLNKTHRLNLVYPRVSPDKAREQAIAFYLTLGTPQQLVTRSDGHVFFDESFKNSSPQPPSENTKIAVKSCVKLTPPLKTAKIDIFQIIILFLASFSGAFLAVALFS